MHLWGMQLDLVKCWVSDGHALLWELHGQGLHILNQGIVCRHCIHHPLRGQGLHPEISKSSGHSLPRRCSSIVRQASKLL